MNEKYPLALPEGTVLAGQYIVEKVLGQGGFGITYEAKDHKTGERVAVKEFFPDAMATRTNQTTVSAFSGEKGENYAYGKTCFLQEAETLAKFIGNENIVRIHSYFEENGTAYFVMDFIEGTSFDEYLKQRGGKIPYEEAARILIPVMDALSAVHSKGIVHRDVTPDNIYITKEGVVKLLDFGAARYSLGDQSRSLDIILKHGFAPKEQYTRRGKQGPYTDIYALGATFYFALTGKRPPDSVERLDEDDLVPPSSLGVQISGAAEDAILKALSVQPADRFQSMMDFKSALLSLQRAPATPAAGQPAVSQIYFNAPDQTGISRTGTTGTPAPAAGQDTDLQDLAATMKTAGKLASRLAGRMAGKMAEKTAETAGIMAGTAGKMSEIMAAKKAETAEKLAAKMAEREAEKAARAAEEAARREAERAAAEAAQQAAEEAAQQAGMDTVGRTAQGAGVSPEEAPAGTAVGETVGAGTESAAGAAVGTAVRSAPAKKGMNMKILIPVAAAAVILIGVFALKPKDTNQNASVKNNSSASTQTTSPSKGSTSEPAPEKSTTPDKSTVPDQSTAPEPAVTLSGDWSVVGNSAANIANNGLRVDGYSIQDDGFSLWDIENKKYIFENDGLTTDLSFVDGMVFFLHEQSAYAYDSKAEQLYNLTYLNDPFGGSIYRFMMTKDFYIVCCANNDGTYTVYRVLRANGETKECCTIPNYRGFTLSDDGWIYYATKLKDKTTSIFRMRLDTLEKDSATLIHTKDPDYTFSNLIVAGDYLYACYFDAAASKSYNIIRINRNSIYLSSDPIWKISSEMDTISASGEFGFNVNKNNQMIYFYASTPSDNGDYIPNLYSMKGYDDGTFDINRISQNSGLPNIMYFNDGTYRVYYLHAEEDDENYGLYYRNYDAEGTYIKNN